MSASHPSRPPESHDQTCPADAIVALDGEAFVAEAYRRLLGRAPNGDERATMLDALLRGEPKAWILGGLRYGAEGRAAGVTVGDAFRRRYLAQRMFRWPGIGRLAERAAAVWRLPASLRCFRAMEQRLNIESSNTTSNRHFEQTALALKRQSADVERLVRTCIAKIEEIQIRLKTIEPPPLDPELAIESPPLVDKALTRSGLPPNSSVASLPQSVQYALFEEVFYESAVVSAKQRIYVPYVRRAIAAKYPFLDLGCGRGEFLRILRDETIASLGIDINPHPLARLRSEGFNVKEQDLIEFLERDEHTYSGVAILQVVEHMHALAIERMLTLVARRLAPGAPIFVETPNPLSPFALAHFHTDPTHLNPIPPERMRYAIEAAGFEGARTLFQNRVPHNQYCGTDRRAYYVDYAIIAYRPSE
jgi:SAM-dependent methyltransferase